MKHFIGILLLASIGSHSVQAQSYSLRTIIRIQSCSDFSYITIPPNGQVTVEPTTAASTTAAVTTTGPTPAGTTTPAPIPAIPIGGNNGGSPNIRHWKVNWALATNNSSTSVVSAVDVTTSVYRFLGWDPTLGLVVQNYATFSGAVISNYAWSFVSFFDSASWTYKYQLRLNGGSGPIADNCLCRMGGTWNTTTCSTTNKAVLFNLING